MPRGTSPTIRELRVRAVRVPLAEPHRTASGVVAESPLVLTDAVTDAGVVGHSMTFTYTPAAGFAGTDTFTYRANDGTWPGPPTAPMSPDSNLATVTITVTNNFHAITIGPLKTPAQLGSAVPVSWTLKNQSGAAVINLDTLVKMESVFNGAPGRGGCVASCTGTKKTLYSPASGATGGSDFRIVAGGYQFNWDTTSANSTGKGCYTLLLTLNDGSAPKLTTPVQLK